MELCTCPKCRQNTITDAEGHTHHGLFVHRTTRGRHWAKFLKQEDDEISQMNQKNSLKSIQQKIISSTQKEKKSTSYSDDENESLPERRTEYEIICLIMCFIMWLHLVCGLSKLNCKRVRDDLVEIILSVSGRFGFDFQFVSSTPHDVRTMNKGLNLEASFERYVFCLKCFSLYDIETAPDDCGYQAVSKSQPCGAELFK
ncbi:hypothetical protein O181_023458 [Austropuccinia psidii MF-1]|uniref:Uncharacterized protein n=1 Tax=Austropuccinia psidii MF-1 TaxID=1389203 RepID=A0A9Q3GXB0_9BASI|nr:hypothetical protein [Austropuccinia psidii MF-1]